MFHEVQRDFRFRFEGYILGNASFFPSRFVIGPFFWQIQAISDGKAGMVVGGGNRNRVLAVVLFAELAAILARDPN